MRALYVGMDLGAKVCVWVAIDSRGKQVLWGEFKTSEKGLIEAFQGLPGEVHLILEECELAGWAFRVLKPLVKEIVVCDPVRNAWVSKASHKNDKVDAGKLAEMLRVNSYKPVYNTMDEGMSGFKRAVQQEMELTEKAKKASVTTGKVPISVAIAALYLSADMLDDKKMRRDVKFPGISNNTIKSRYDELLKKVVQKEMKTTKGFSV